MTANDRAGKCLAALADYRARNSPQPNYPQFDAAVALISAELSRADALAEACKPFADAYARYHSNGKDAATGRLGMADFAALMTCLSAYQAGAGG